MKKRKGCLVAVLVGVVALISVLLLARDLTAAVYSSVPEAIARDPAVQQARRVTQGESKSRFNVGHVWLGKRLDRLDSVRVQGPELLMYILEPENSFSLGGSAEHQILEVYIEGQDRYIEGFAVYVNGERFQLTKQPVSLLSRLLGEGGSKDEGPRGRWNWTNRWFPLSILRPPPANVRMPEPPPSRLIPPVDQEYVWRVEPLPYKMESDVIVSWTAADPSNVIVTNPRLVRPITP